MRGGSCRAGGIGREWCAGILEGVEGDVIGHVVGCREGRVEGSDPVGLVSGTGHHACWWITRPVGEGSGKKRRCSRGGEGGE